MLSDLFNDLFGEFLGDNYLLIITVALFVFIVLFIIGGFKK